MVSLQTACLVTSSVILEDPGGADGGKGKSERATKKKSKTVKKSLDRSRLFFAGCFRDRFAPTICPGVPRMRDQM